MKPNQAGQKGLCGVSRAPFFILGCQRSGTTLLRLMLNAHSRIAIPEEGTFWMPLLRKFKAKTGKPIRSEELEKHLDYIKKNSQFDLWDFDPSETIQKIKKMGRPSLSKVMSEFYEQYARSREKDIWGDKTPSFFRMIPTLAKLFPEARFLNMVRDGRDLYLSWKKMQFIERNASVAAVEWSHKTSTVARGLDRLHPKRYLRVRYEDLVEKPDRVLTSICSFLGIEFESEMKDYWKTSKRFIGAHHSDLIFKPISLRSVGKWRKELCEKEIKNFESIAGNTLVSLGYELSRTDNRKLGVPISALIELGVGIPKRAFQVFRTARDLDRASKLGLTTDSAGSGTPPCER